MGVMTISFCTGHAPSVFIMHYIPIFRHSHKSLRHDSGGYSRSYCFTIVRHHAIQLQSWHSWRATLPLALSIDLTYGHETTHPLLILLTKTTSAPSLANKKTSTPGSRCRGQVRVEVHHNKIDQSLILVRQASKRMSTGLRPR
jgi:hypothetical protein